MCGWQNAPTSASAPKWEVKEYILNPDLRRNTGNLVVVFFFYICIAKGFLPMLFYILAGLKNY